MKIKVYMKGKDDKPVFCCMFSEKQKAKESDFAFIDRILKAHEYDLFDEPIYETGISTVCTLDDMKSTFRQRNGEYVLPNPVVFGDAYERKQSNIYIGLDMFREGWCIKITTLDGETRYFHKINRRTVNTNGTLMGAHLYNSVADVKRELQNKIGTLGYCTSNFGWTLELVEASEEFKRDYAASKHTKHEQELMTEVRRMFDELNAKGSN